MIIARKLTVIQKNGVRLDYTHVEALRTNENWLFVTGETDIALDNMRGIVHDRFRINDLEMMVVDWYIPKT